MTTIVRVTFDDGETAVISLDFTSPAIIGMVLRAWGFLYLRDVVEWKPTSESAVFWYDVKTKKIYRSESGGYDELAMLLPIAALRKKLLRPSWATPHS